MSEDTQMTEIVDVVKTAVSEATELKADKAQVEAVEKSLNELEIPSIDGLVSKSEVEEMVKQSETNHSELLKSTLASLPVSKSKGPSSMIKFEDTNIGGQIVKAQEFNVIHKAYSDNTDVAGGRVDTNSPYYKLEQANFARRLGTIFPASGGIVKLPDVNSITWASEATQPAAPRTPGGDLASKNVTIETWVSENSYSLASLEDVPSMDPAITGLMTDQLGVSEADDAVAVVKAATGLAGAVTTGVATGLPTAANIFGKTMDMVTPLTSAYRNSSRFVMSREYFSTLQQSNNNGINFDPTTGLTTVGGYLVEVVDALETSDTDGNLAAIFGNFSRGLVLATAANITIGRYDQTRPGAMTYFGRARFKHAIWDVNGLVTMKIGA